MRKATCRGLILALLMVGVGGVATAQDDKRATREREALRRAQADAGTASASASASLSSSGREAQPASTAAVISAASIVPLAMRRCSFNARRRPPAGFGVRRAGRGATPACSRCPRGGCR